MLFHLVITPAKVFQRKKLLVDDGDRQIRDRPKLLLGEVLLRSLENRVAVCLVLKWPVGISARRTYISISRGLLPKNDS